MMESCMMESCMAFSKRTCGSSNWCGMAVVPVVECPAIVLIPLSRQDILDGRQTGQHILRVVVSLQ